MESIIHSSNLNLSSLKRVHPLSNESAEFGKHKNKCLSVPRSSLPGCIAGNFIGFIWFNLDMQPINSRVCRMQGAIQFLLMDAGYSDVTDKLFFTSLQPPKPRVGRRIGLHPPDPR